VQGHSIVPAIYCDSEMIKKDNSDSISKFPKIHKIVLFPKIHKGVFHKTSPVVFPKIIKSKPTVLIRKLKIRNTSKKKVFPKIHKTKEINNTKREREYIPIEYETSVRLITQLIIDSKINLVKKPETNKYFISSKYFLMNTNRLLEYYLECINMVDVKSCLKELRYYATEGYLKDIVNDNKV